MSERWDSFSWFGIDKYDAQGEIEVSGKREGVEVDTIARTLELIAILIAAPPLNRSKGRFKGAEKIDQAPVDGRLATVKSTAKLVEELGALLAELQKLDKKKG